MSINETKRELSPIRKALVDGIRNSDKPAKVKAAAEVLISTIDMIEKHGADPQAMEQFQINYAFFVRAAGHTPVPPELSPAEIAKAFGLHHRDLQ